MAERPDDDTVTSRATDRAAAVRDGMLERSQGMPPPTRYSLLVESWLWLWEREVPPALYFDSSEPPAVFLGAGSACGPDNALRDKIGCHVRDLVQDPDTYLRVLEDVLDEAPSADDARPD